MGRPLTPEQQRRVRLLWWQMQNCGLSAHLGPEFECRYNDAREKLRTYLTSADGRMG